MRSVLSCLVLFFVCSVIYGQKIKLDSLWAVYNNSAQSDTSRLKAIHDIARSYQNNNPDTAIIIAEREIQLAEKARQKKYQANALNTIGTAYWNEGNYSRALDYYLQALQIREETKDKKGVGGCYGNIGNVYYLQADYPKALEYYFKGLKIGEELRDKNGTGLCLTNVGVVYFDQGDYQKALEYASKALLVYQELGDKDGIQNCYNNIASIYGRKSDYYNALDYYFKALKICQEINNKEGVGLSYSNIGIMYQDLKMYPKAQNYFQMSLSVYKEIGGKGGMGFCYNNLGGLFTKIIKYELAIQYCDSSLKITKELGDLNEQLKSYEILSEVNSKTGNYKKAFESHVKWKLLTDSIFSTDKNKQMGDLKTSFAVEKKEAEMKIIAKEEKKRQRTIVLAVAGILVIVLVFSFFLYRRFKLTQRQRDIIVSQVEMVEQQKEEAEKQRGVADEKRKEIVDSIHYAKRIQDALMKEQEDVSLHLPEHFILFKPKDIVSGDFYWSFEKQHCWYIAAADCTGHGVPGAFLTMLGTSFLNEINSVQELLQPAEILNQLRERIIKELHQTGKAGESKDGMDISLIQLNLETKEVQWAGANNSLYRVLKGELVETKADKQPIGYADNLRPFTNHSFQMGDGETIYIFSDGYADQFGGPHSKKFMSKQMKETFTGIADLELAVQKEKLSKIFEDWKGDLQQIDDVCVIGIKI